MDIRERFYEILDERKKFLYDNETLIYIKDGQMIAQWHDGESLCEVCGDKNELLQNFLNWLYDDNSY